MVKIMQENGEVVVVLGSSANYHNIQTFLTADASLSVEPLYPQVLIFSSVLSSLSQFICHGCWLGQDSLRI
jgi:hypothetical protein